MSISTATREQVVGRANFLHAPGFTPGVLTIYFVGPARTIQPSVAFARAKTKSTGRPSELVKAP